MSLSAQEEQVLGRITDGLTGSDSGLVALLGTFNRLASGEKMPPREMIRPGSPEAVGCAGRGRHPHRSCRYPRQGNRRQARWAPPLLWLAITLSLITVALVTSGIGSPGRCAASLAMVCSHPDAVHSLYAAGG